MLEQIGARGESRQSGVRRRIELQQLDGVCVEAVGRKLIETASGGKGQRAGSAGAERIAHITVAAGVLVRPETGSVAPPGNKARGSRIEDCAAWNGASKNVGSGRTSRLGEDIGEIGVAAAAFQRGRNRACRSLP